MDKNWNKRKRNPTETSCATNQYGVYWDTTSKKTQFKQCSTKFMKKNKWECKKGFPIGYEFEKCRKYWKKAHDFIDKQSEKIQRDFQHAQKIKINSMCENWTPECLDVSFFTGNGHCIVKGGNIDDWGICDTSCKHAKVLASLFCKLIVFSHII